jgi:sterol desaturase/sphingolipid hydroxylase (fatty acid hydroxylase superfamily)
MGHDLRYTITTLVLTLVTGAATTVLVLEDVIPLSVGWPTGGGFVIEVAAYVVLFDAYFYGLHRVLHVPVLYRSVHAVHHRSTAPTVTTALAFHPLEALSIIAFMPAAMCLFPIHLASLAVVSTLLSGSILLAHCGHEVFPQWWQRIPVLNWYVTPRIHDVHHVRRDCNYSATLVIFDRLFGTMGVSVPSPPRSPRRRASPSPRPARRARG